jgi:aspartate racemase
MKSQWSDNVVLQEVKGRKKTIVMTAPPNTTYLSDKKIGIITGSGPEAGICQWQRIIQAAREQLGETYRGDVDAPEVEVFSKPALGFSMWMPQCAERVWETLRVTLLDVSTRVDILCIACFTLHAFEDRIQDIGLDCKFMSLIDAVASRVEKLEVVEALVLDARDHSESKSPIETAVQRHTRTVLYDDRDRLRQLIFDVKKLGPDHDSLKSELLSIISGYAGTCVILGCTELCMLQVKDPNRHIIDGMSLVAEQMVADLYR